MDKDTLHWYEKTALGLAMSAQALVVMQWYLDGNYPADWLRTVLQWVVVVVAVAAGIALDAVVVTTVMGRREGRRGLWGWLTAGSAAIFSALVALHMSGGWSAGAWLHVAYPVTTFLFAQHLSTPRKIVQDLNEIEQLSGWLEQSKTDAKQWQRQAEHERQRAEQLDIDYKRALDCALEFEGRAKFAEASAKQISEERQTLLNEIEEAANKTAEASKINLARLVEVLEGKGIKQREIGALLNMSASSVNSLLKRAKYPELFENTAEQAARNGHAKEVLA